MARVRGVNPIMITIDAAAAVVAAARNDGAATEAMTSV